MRILRRILAGIICLYVIVGASLYFFQQKFIFHPDPLPADYKFNYDVPFDEIKLPINDKVLLSAIRFKTAHPKGVVLYFHGNARNISFYAPKAADFTRNGYEVLMMDYPGYGKSTGPLKEEVIYANALHMYEIARSQYAPDSIIIYGRSLGTGVAAELASVRDCKKLVLEAPYYNMTDMAYRMAPIYPYGLMLEYFFPTNEFLPRVTAPITILHGTADNTVPIASGQKLKKFLKQGDQFVAIPGGGHNNLGDYPLFHQSLDQLLR